MKRPYNSQWHVLVPAGFLCVGMDLCVSLVFEPGADGLQRPISTAPAIVIYSILHIMVVTICTWTTQTYIKKKHSKILTVDVYVIYTYVYHLLR